MNDVSALVAAIGFGGPAFVDWAHDALDERAQVTKTRSFRSFRTPVREAPPTTRHLLDWIDANCWPIGVAMVCFAPRARRRTLRLQQRHRLQLQLISAAEETGLGRSLIRFALPTIPEESSSVGSSSLQPSPRIEVDAGTMGCAWLEDTRFPAAESVLRKLPPSPTPPNSPTAQGVAWDAFGLQTLPEESAVVTDPGIQQDWPQEPSKEVRQEPAPRSPDKAPPQAARETPVRSQAQRQQCQQKESKTPGAQRRPEPFRAAELVPFFEEPAPLVRRLLDEEVDVDPWEAFFLDQSEDKPMLHRLAARFTYQRTWRNIKLIPPVSPTPSASPFFSPSSSPRCGSASRESTTITDQEQESLPRAWPLGRLLYLERRGSVFYRYDSVLGGLIVAGLGALVQYSRDHGWELYAPEIQHHYGFQALGAGVTFAIVFRTQLAWNRYWEAVTQLHFMYSKFADAFSQFYAFSEVTIRAAQRKGDEDKMEDMQEKQRRLKSNFALLSMLAADRLSNGDNQRMEEVHSHRVRSRSAMRVDKEWKGFTLPSIVERKDFNRAQIDDKVFVVFEKPTQEQLRVLSRTYDTVSTVMYWIIWDLADATSELSVAPPIQSRMYQELSNGMLGFYNCLKIADVPFPLPYAQLLGLLLIAFSCLIPFYVIIFTSSPVIGPVLCFFLFESLWCLNEVAKELENPFGQDLNDISVIDFHVRFVDVIEDVTLADQQAVLWPHRPGSSTCKEMVIG
ncbi:unnamed protein product [Effrenium voratum]|uniref:Uncharacterized protein n=1 Tax=Effrenium voratum TaxID=2562239 RepID=A0AA36J096_9DINO|nr:unnamed protein product [Effrenium voratum]